MALGLIMASAQAGATAVNVSGANGEDTLQEILDSLVISGTTPDVNANQYALDEYWEHTNSGNASATMIVELAGFRNGNELGIYARGNTANRVAIYPGASGPGARVSITRSFDSGTGIYTFRVIDLDAVALIGEIMTGNPAFGFYLDTPQGNTFYSDETLNSDGADHMVAFQGNGQTVDLPTVGELEWNMNGFILAWEDLLASEWDYDYNDLVLMVESVTGVPEPGAMLLLGSGLLGFGLGRRNRRQS
jgi:hypothetical protein